MTTTNATITVTIDGYEAERTKDWLTERLGQKVAEGLDEKVADAIEARVKSLVDELTRERLKKEIDAALDAGWKGTDSYGNPNGKSFTLQDRVRGIFEQKSDSYSGSGTLVTKWIQESVNRELAVALKDEVAKAKERLRAAFDDVLKAKFADTVRDALGLRT